MIPSIAEGYEDKKKHENLILFLGDAIYDCS